MTSDLNTRRGVLSRASTVKCYRSSSSPGLSLAPFLRSTLPGPSASEVTTLWRYTNTFIIVIFLNLIKKIPQVVKIPGVKNYKS